MQRDLLPEQMKPSQIGERGLVELGNGEHTARLGSHVRVVGALDRQPYERVHNLAQRLIRRALRRLEKFTQHVAYERHLGLISFRRKN